MPSVLVTFYSRSGNTQKMAELVAEGVREVDGVECKCVPVGELKVDDLLSYDGIIVGSPTYYGLMAAELKQMFDESVKFHGKLQGKVGAAFSSAANIGGGNETTIRSIIDALLIHGMVVQGNSQGDHYGPVSIGAPDERAAKQCRSLGKRTAELVKKLFG